MGRMRSGLLVLGLLALTLTGTLLAAEKAAPIKAKPSANAGKKGQYSAPTSVGDYSYHVFVPASYSDDNPAGLHLHFSGQGGCAENNYFGQWAKHFLEPFNLIGINMKYPDGDNMKNTSGKVAAAREAIAQVIADYKVIVGRGVICSFSGGGLPHGMLFGQSGKTRGPDFPFCQMAQYSSNFNARIPPGTCSLGWFFSVGSAEWGLASLGKSATSHMADLLEQAAKGGDTDLFLKIIKGKGHSIDDAEVASSSVIFKRADLAHAPFLYEPDYPEEKLAPLVKQANALTLGPVLPALERILNDGKSTDDLKKKAEALKQRVTGRVKAIMDVANGLATSDPVLFAYYARKFSPQLAGLPEAKELQTLTQKTTSSKDFPRWTAQLKTFSEIVQQAFTASCTPLNAKAVPLIEEVQKTAPEKSLLGQMAAEFLLLK
jgi:hypothetical protein